MKLVLFAFILLFSSFGLSASDLKVFDNDMRQAVAAARAEGKWIVFFLYDNSVDKHQSMAQFLADDLAEMAADFVLVRCDSSVPGNRSLFTTRFEEDLSTLPIAVISDQTGSKQASTHGLKSLDYHKMFVSAKLQSGKVTDPAEIAKLKKELLRVVVKSDNSSSFLGVMLDDVKQTKIALTPMRDWTRTDDETFRAALLQALGDRGRFVDDEGETFEVKFTDFSKADVDYLKQILTVQSGN